MKPRQPDLFAPRWQRQPPAPRPVVIESFDGWDLERMTPVPGWEPPEEVRLAVLGEK